MHFHVEEGKMELAKIEQRVVDVFSFDDRVDDLLRHPFAGLVVMGETDDFGRAPAPVFEHLGGSFNKVAYDTSSVKACIFGDRDEVVDTMTKFMEESCLGVSCISIC